MILNKFEEKFQNDFIKVSCSRRWSAYHLSGESGLHDIIMSQKKISRFVELKAVQKKYYGHSIQSQFQPAQMGFYLRQIQTSFTPTLIAIKWLEDSPVYTFTELNDTHEVINFFAKKCVDIKNDHYIHLDIESLIGEITRDI